MGGTLSTTLGNAHHPALIAPFRPVNVSLDYAYGKDDVEEGSLIDVRHPEYCEEVENWIKWRLTYKGGKEFIDEFLYNYSKREDPIDYEARKRLSYNPGHAKAVVNIIRNSLMMKVPDVKRDGDSEYLDAAMTNIDGFKSSMSAFMGFEVIPLLLAQGKRFIAVDAPRIHSEGILRSEVAGSPFVWAVNAEDVLSWSYAKVGGFTSILMREKRDVIHEPSGLVSGQREQYRYMRLTDNSYTEDIKFNEEALSLRGPGVLLLILNDKGDLLERPEVLQLERIPVVELKLVDSIMSDIADMQISLLQLASTDMSFLFRGNFPLYIEQYDPSKSTIKPRGSKRREQQEEMRPNEDPLQVDQDTRGMAAGSGHGRRYAKELDAPNFIAPDVDNLRVSMEKQSQIQQEIRMLVNLGLVSMSVKAVEQSGASKRADMIGEEAGLQYIANQLETGEREIAGHFHAFIGRISAPVEVVYPSGYTIRTEADRKEEMTTLKEARSLVRSSTFQKMVERRVVHLIGNRIGTQDEVEAASQEVMDAPTMDDNTERSDQVEKDVMAGVLSRESASVIRGYGEDEYVKSVAESEIESDRRSGGPDDQPFFKDEDEDEDITVAEDAEGDEDEDKAAR